MNNVSWMDHPAMKNIDPRKLELLKELTTETEGMSIEKTLPLLMKTNGKLKSMNLQFSKEESEIMIDILSQNMSPAEKVKLENMKRMMGKMK